MRCFCDLLIKKGINTTYIYLNIQTTTRGRGDLTVHLNETTVKTFTTSKQLLNMIQRKQLLKDVKKLPFQPVNYGAIIQRLNK